jgi:Asp/Glu/hydantoin racemase
MGQPFRLVDEVLDSIGRARPGFDRGKPQAMTNSPTLGLLMLDTRFPRLAGDVGHAATFSFPVRRRIVAGAAPARVVRASDAAVITPFVAAGHWLVREHGVAAIATSCGFLARWQRELQAALPVPVWSSALVALAAELAGQRCGVITIEAASLTPAHFTAAGADPATPVEGITAGSPLHRSLLEDRATLDAVDAQAQVLAAAARLLARHPGIETLLLECTNLPPYAAALHAATGRPVHDIVTVVEARMAALAANAAA